jgi:hypothetical protein
VVDGTIFVLCLVLVVLLCREEWQRGLAEAAGARE